MTTRRTYEDSLRSKLIRFFTENPDEILLRKDMYRKFDAAPSNVDSTIRRMKEDGELEHLQGYRLKQPVV